MRRRLPLFPSWPASRFGSEPHTAAPRALVFTATSCYQARDASMRAYTAVLRPQAQLPAYLIRQVTQLGRPHSVRLVHLAAAFYVIELEPVES